MHRLFNSSRAYLLVVASLLATAAYAAGIEANARKDYGRINFTFAQPTAMNASSSGTTATLIFASPLTDSPDAIQAALPDYVTASSLSADKKTLTLTLSKPYRIRQFTSGNKVGLDLIAQKNPPAAITTAKVEPKADILSTKKPEVAAKPVPKPAAPVKPKPEVKAAPVVAPPKTASILTTRKPPVEPAAPTPPVLSTKPTEVPKADDITLPVMTTKAPEPPPEPTKPEPEPVVTAAEPKPEPVAEPAAPSTPAVAEKPAAAPAPVDDGKPFIVTSRSVNGDTVINFPWKSRTAAAVFKRDRDLWVVFSNYADVNASLLNSVMPKNVVGVTQYAYAGNSVLRIATDGNIYAQAAQAKSGFGWNVTLSNAEKKPSLDVTLSTDTLEGTTRLLLGVYDVAPTVRFYDPTIGDRLIIVPAYEDGRGVPSTRHYPEFSVISTNQGVAIISRGEDFALTPTRAGLVLNSAHGLAVSDSLPLLANKEPLAGVSANSGVMMPYDQWYVPSERFRDTLAERLQAMGAASKATKAESIMELVKLYLSYGMGPEALGELMQIKEQFPQYYATNRLAMLTAVCHILMNHMELAAAELAAPELNDSDEANLWRQVAALSIPPANNEVQRIQQEAADAVPAEASDSHGNDGTTPLPTSDVIGAPTNKVGVQFLKYSRPYIRYYPPRIRQLLARVAADAYLADGQEEKALAVYDTLMRDNILTPLKLDAEYTLGAVAAKKGETDQALAIFDRLTKQVSNLRVAARAKFSAAMLRYQKEQLTADAAAELIEQARMGWRGDDVEHEMLRQLVTIYKDSKRYDEVLRTYRAIVDGFPKDSDAFAIAGEMADLFQRIFLDGLADDMEPLRALSLFYEFRELTPLGDNGDLIIQRLADRLAAIDLLDSATQLLESQIKFRTTGEARSKIGARLALMHLLNKHPKEALSVLEVTNFGTNVPELKTLRLQLTAQALMKLDKNEEALGVIYNDATPTGALLRLDILWAMKDWPNIVNSAEDILGSRPNLTDPLTNKETEVLLKLALAYIFESDYTQLRYLRDYYSGLIPDSAYKQVFDYITNDTTPLDPEDFDVLAQQINRTEGFLGIFKEKIASGKLSEAVK